MRRALASLLLVAACEGPKGPEGAPGPTGDVGPIGQVGSIGPSGTVGPQGNPGDNGEGGVGPTGDAGASGAPGCPGLSAGQTPGLTVSLTISSPKNGSFFVAGEQPVATIRFSNSCGPLSAAQLGTANLYLYGPRDASATTAERLLNCVVDRGASDGQHHYVNLKSPHFADTAQSNLSQSSDGTLSFTFAPISSEAPGSYTAGVWAKSPGDVDQAFPLADVQIGSATAQTYATGPSDASSCFDCHRTPGDDKAQMHHSRPSQYGPLGNWSLDLAPVGTCKACHNLDGYSVNSTLRKTHTLHRGAHQLAVPAGAAHPEYNLPADSTMADYLNVEFPSMPGLEKDCTKCHSDDRWMQSPSRLACGTCHDNLYFDSGTFNPPRLFGVPSSGACHLDSDCYSFDKYAVCVTNAGDPNFGACVHDVHWAPAPGDSDPDGKCAICHNEAPGAPAPVSAAHEIYATTRIPGLKVTAASLAGAATSGVFQPGDVPTITFSLADKSGAPVTDLKPAPSPNPYSATAILSGPTTARQRVFGPITVSLTAASFVNNGGGSYSYTFPSPLPAAGESPYNTLLAPSPMPTGTYTVLFYVNKSLSSNGQSFRDVANAIVDFPFLGEPGDATPPVKPRQVVTNAACNSCHTDVQAHGGGRKDIAGECSMCHTEYAVDRGTDVPATGAQCIVANNNCPQFQTCLASASAKAPNNGICTLTTDPTPGQPIDFSKMIHNIHFARLREGYAESAFLSPWTGKLAYVGFNDSVSDESDVLFPEDIRGCAKCHGDAGNSCSSDTQCGVGQHCVSKKCVNNAWLAPSARACVTCHDSDYATGHAALNTWTPPSGAPVETCPTCHDADGQFSVESVHQIRNPYVPTYARTAE
jgi:hypothetical protein